MTNGPIVMLRTESGKRPGDTIQLPKDGGRIKVHVEALSDQPLTAVELVVNGELAASFDIDDAKRVTGSREVRIDEGSWIAAQCTAQDGFLTDAELAAYQDASDNQPPRVAPSRLRFAHSSPIYVTVGGESVAITKSVMEGFQMLAAFAAFAKRTADEPYLAATNQAIQHVRVRLMELAAGRSRDDVASYMVHRTERPIDIDGRLDELAWRTAPPVGDFAFPWWTSGEKERTEAKLLWDDECLYVSFRCEDAHVWAEHTQRDSAVYRDDCVEVFTAPNPTRPFDYFNVEMNVGGAFLDQHHPGGPGTSEEPDWNAKGVEIATQVDGTLNNDDDTDHSWVLEAAIPFANFEAAARHTPPHNRDVWHLNLNRLGGKTNPQYSQWSPGKTKRPAFHAPQYFGRVIFSKAPSGKQ